MGKVQYKAKFLESFQYDKATWFFNGLNTSCLEYQSKYELSPDLGPLLYACYNVSHGKYRIDYVYHAIVSNKTQPEL